MLSNVVSKHLLLAQSVLCLFVDLKMVAERFLTILGNKKNIVSCGNIWIMEYYWR